MWNTHSDERTGLSFSTAAGFASAVIFGSEFSGTHDHTFTVSDSRLPPNWKARSPYLYPPGTGWPASLYSHGMDRRENTASNSLSIVALASCSAMSCYCVFTNLLPNNGRVCTATAASAGFTVLALSKYATFLPP
jgi:hypothetical protein